MTRHERKMARNARFEQAAILEQQLKATAELRRKEFERLHPVSSGSVPLVDYQPPPGRYESPARILCPEVLATDEHR